jgi:hypothetical protein
MIEKSVGLLPYTPYSFIGCRPPQAAPRTALGGLFFLAASLPIRL